MSESPCYGCIERYESCHSYCEYYQEWKHKRTSIVEKERERRKEENVIISLSTGAGYRKGGKRK